MVVWKKEFALLPTITSYIHEHSIIVYGLSCSLNVYFINKKNKLVYYDVIYPE